jgi:hypothetical protein
MNNRTIEIIIRTTGEIQIDAVGFKGPDCEKATAFLEEALGVVGQKTKKPEYHQHGARTNQQKLQARRTHPYSPRHWKQFGLTCPRFLRLLVTWSCRMTAIGV